MQRSETVLHESTALIGHVHRDVSEWISGLCMAKSKWHYMYAHLFFETADIKQSVQNNECEAINTQLLLHTCVYLYHIKCTSMAGL